MIRPRPFLAAAAILLTAGAAFAQAQGGKRRPNGTGGGYADPSGVIAAEIALGQLSVAKGEREALVKTGARDAILFAPDPSFADRWAKSAKAPLGSVRWGTEKVYMSCDGRVAVATGRYTRSDGESGAYETIWRRDPKAGFRWILNHRAPSGTAPATRDPDEGIEIDAKVAFCKKRAARPDQPQAPAAAESRPALDPRQQPPAMWEDKAEDGSLRWRWSVAADKMLTLDMWMANEGGETRVVHVVSASIAP